MHDCAIIDRVLVRETCFSYCCVYRGNNGLHQDGGLDLSMTSLDPAVDQRDLTSSARVV